MSKSAHPGIPKTPWHLWVVGITSLLWNAMGAFDFAMTMTQNEGYMSAFTEEQLTYFYSLPVWVNVAWGIAVIGGVIGSGLLLLRQKLAYGVFIASFVAMVATTIHNYFIADGLKIMGGIGPILFSVVIFLVALLLVIYARKMSQKGILG